MYNLYSMTAGKAAILVAARAMRDGTGNMAHLPNIYPDAAAPIVRTGADGTRELAIARWGMPSPPFALGGKPVDRGITNVRNTTRSHWRRWLGPASRALAPFTSFAESDRIPDGRSRSVWFALGNDQPLAFVAAVWTQWRGVRKLGEGEADHDLFGFLTTEPNADAGAVNPKAMPVILTEPDQVETWMTAPWEEAQRLLRPLPSGALRIVRRGGRNDGGAASQSTWISRHRAAADQDQAAAPTVPIGAGISQHWTDSFSAPPHGGGKQVGGKRCELAVAIDFRLGGNAASFVREGFSHPEQTHTWALAPASRLRLPTVTGGSSAFALLHVDDVFFHPPDGPGLRIIARATNQTLFDAHVREATIIGLELPPTRDSEPDIEITLEYLGAIPPSEVGHVDTRPLTVRFASAWVVVGPPRTPGPPDPAEHAAVLRALENLEPCLPARRIRWSEGATSTTPPWSRPKAKRAVVFVGNCLAGTLARGLSGSPAAEALFSFAEIPLHMSSLDDEQSRNLLSRADVIFVQGIVRADFERVQHRARPACAIVHYPDVIARHGWPFLDGEDHERLMRAREGTRFIHVDDALERLRGLVPDRRRRVEAYAALAHGLEGASQRSAEAQTRFLKDIDRATGTGIGRFIQHNFRVTRLFHDSVHPSHALGEEICRFVMRRLGISDCGDLFGDMDSAGGYAVPVHPILAERLGLAWAGPNQRFRYGVLGEVTWREWVEAYVADYG